MADHEHYMRIALEEAKQGAAEGNAAVGSILVRAESVVARPRSCDFHFRSNRTCGNGGVTNVGEQLGHLADFLNAPPEVQEGPVFWEL